jgi:lycopene cyclase domain-containing protein
MFRFGSSPPSGELEGAAAFAIIMYTYFLILLLSFAGPLGLSFDKKVHFYTKWKALFAAMILPAIFYCVWDSIFVNMGIWSFAPEKIVGLHIVNLPIEEVLFFFIIPYCSVFVYECVCCYFPKLQSTKTADYIIYAIGAFALLVGMFNVDKWYTATTGIFLAVFILCFFILRKYFSSFNSKAFLVAYIIIQIPFLVVNGFLTAIPVVLYNNAENLATRIYTIPVEDTFYGMLHIMMVVVGYEKFLKRV